ncbi:hypothetical protein [Parafilimonas sp.]|uniref:hypothetical protein n=1 Tax=Parafilimonas sp. TaxID=1969739 RepID=UPI003F7EDB32
METENLLETEDEILHEKKRPTSIRVICVLGFIGTAFIIPVIFSDVAKQIGSWYPSYLALTSIVGLVCMIGLWQMKKWAAYTYTGFMVINQIVLWTMGIWNVMALIIPGIVVAITLANLKRMD